MTVRKVNLTEMFGRFRNEWSPKVVGEVNDSLVKLVKFRGNPRPAVRAQLDLEHRKRPQ